MPMPRSRQSIRGAATLAAATVVLAACGGGGDGSGADATPAGGAAVEAPSDASSPNADQTPQVAELEAALTEAFASSTTLDGDTEFDGATLAGRDSVVWFWAPWCTICRGEAPEVAEVAAMYGPQIDLIGVPGRGEIDAMHDFADDTGTDAFTNVPDLNGNIWSAFGVYAQPSYAFIDDDGTVEVFIGGMGGDALAERIDQLIAN